jgi:hypothetical protein
VFTLINEEPDQTLYRYRSLLLNVHWMSSSWRT